MKTINLDAALNPAMFSALQHATNRAAKEGKACCVYVAGPDAEQVLTPNNYNVWYVRLASEPAPENSQLYRTIYP